MLLVTLVGQILVLYCVVVDEVEHDATATPFVKLIFLLLHTRGCDFGN